MINILSYLCSWRSLDRVRGLEKVQLATKANEKLLGPYPQDMCIYPLAPRKGATALPKASCS